MLYHNNDLVENFIASTTTLISNHIYKDGKNRCRNNNTEKVAENNHYNNWHIGIVI